MQRTRKSISIGSGFEFINDSSPVPPVASFEGKVQHVNQGKYNARLYFFLVDSIICLVYKTDVEEPEAVLMPHVGGGGFSPAPNAGPAFQDKFLAPEVLVSTVVEDVPKTPRGTRLMLPTSETLKAVYDPTLPLAPDDPIGSIGPFGDSDEFSEISEFGPENDTVNEQASTGRSASCNHKLKSTQHEIDRIHTHGSSGATTTMEIRRSSDSASEPGGRTEGVARRSLERRKPLLMPVSPISGPPSSTQFDVDTYPPTARNVIGHLSVASQDFNGTDRLEKPGVNGEPSATEVVASAGNPQTGFRSTEDEFRQHTRRFPPCANQKVHSVNEITKDTSILPKVAGNRRKRETIESSSKAIIDVDDESTPPRKKSRTERFRIKKNKTKPNETSLDTISISRTKRLTKPIKGSSPSTDPTMIDFDELPEPMSTHQGTRRSSRIKKRQTAATAETRTNARRGKTQKANRAGSLSAYGMECKKLITVSLPDPSLKIGHDISSVCGVPPEPIPIGESLSLKCNSDVVSKPTFAIVGLDFLSSTAFYGVDEYRK